ncbi:MAG: hypothetical protein GY757_50085, partial [bacterium]|nr:hypothetical protein [bacterium]
MPQTTNIAIKPTAKQKAEQLQLHLTTSPQTHDWPFERLAKDSPHHSALYVLYVLYVHSVHPVHNVHNVLYVLYVHPVH